MRKFVAGALIGALVAGVTVVGAQTATDDSGTLAQVCSALEASASYTCDTVATTTTTAATTTTTTTAATTTTTVAPTTTTAVSAPTVSFVIDNTSGPAPLSVHVDVTAANADWWQMDWGGGLPQRMGTIHPATDTVIDHDYPDSGTYPLILKAWRDSDGAQVTATNTVTVTSAATTTTVAPTTTTVAASTVGQEFGGYATPIGAYQTVAYNQNDAQKVKAAGFNWVRVDATVKAVMPCADAANPACRNYQSMWNWVDAFEDRGVKPMVNWYILPSWMNGSGDDKTQPTTDALYANSLREAAPLMWAHGVKAIELWNEQNLSGFWKPTPDRARYVRMAIEAAKAIRETAPGMLIVTGGISTADTQYQNGTGKTVTRYDNGQSYTTTEVGANATIDIYGALGLYAAKDAAGRPLFDGVGVHPYLDDHLPQPGGIVDGWMRWQGNAMRRTIGLLDKWGGQALKVWNTESAAPRSTMSETEQANRASAAFKAFNDWTLANGAKMRTRLGPYFYFTYSDWTSASEVRARTFGLVFPNYTDHPARPAVSAVLDDPLT